MQFFRKKYARLILTIFTGIIFVNMGFFLMEVKILGLDQNGRMMANITRMIAGSALEEERDSTASSSNSGFGEEEYVFGHHHADYSGNFLIIDDAPSACHIGNLARGYIKKFCPPPEV